MTYLIDHICSIHFCQRLFRQFAQILGKAFQHFLVMFKSLLLVGVGAVGSCQIVSVHVSVFENSSTFDQLFVGSFEKFQVPAS